MDSHWLAVLFIVSVGFEVTCRHFLTKVDKAHSLLLLDLQLTVNAQIMQVKQEIMEV
jgi:hypothetical protein